MINKIQCCLRNYSEFTVINVNEIIYEARNLLQWVITSKCYVHLLNGPVPVNFIARLQHDDVIKWKHFPRYWPFVLGIHRSPVNSPHTGQWRGALMISLIWACINGWVNHRKAGDLRRHRTHYDVTVMSLNSLPSVHPVAHPLQTLPSGPYRMLATAIDALIPAYNSRLSHSAGYYYRYEQVPHGVYLYVTHNAGEIYHRHTSTT